MENLCKCKFKVGEKRKNGNWFTEDITLLVESASSQLSVLLSV